MSKKALAVVIVTISILLAGMVWFSGRGQGRLNSFVIDEKTAADLMSGRSLVRESAPDIYFDEEKSYLDTSSDTFYYSLVEGSKSAYNPKVRATLGGELASVYFIEARISDELISSNTSISMIVCNKDSYYLCELICTTLPIISIEADEEIGDEDSDMRISVFDNGKDAVRRLTESWGYIRIRGVMSRNFPKQSYKLTLKTESLGRNSRNDNQSLLGMRKDDDWVLNSLYSDYEKVRNTFNHNLWTESCGTDNEYGIETGICYKYCEVFMNGRYWGLYTIGYRPDEKTLSSQNLTEDEGLYKKLIFNVSGYRADDYSMDTVYEYYTEFEEAEGNQDALKQLIDMDNCIDFNLFTTMTQGIDNLEHNYYLLIKESNGQKKGIFVPWDLDLCWGNEWTLNDNNHVSYYSMPADLNLLFTDSPLYELLAEKDAETYGRLLSKYQQLRDGAWSDEKLMQYIDEYEKDIFGSGAYYRDSLRWTDGNYVDGMTNLDTFREFVSTRVHYMDSYIDRLKTGLTDNQFINECLKYENIEESRFVIEVRDNSVLDKEEYREFLNWLGVDASKISENGGYAICEPGSGKVEYIDSSFEQGEVHDTELGQLMLVYDENDNYNHEDDYTVLLDGIKCFVSSSAFRKAIAASCINKGRGDELYLKSGYMDESELWDIPNQDFMLRYLDNYNGKMLLRVNDTKSDLIDRNKFLEQFDLDLAFYSSVSEAFDDNDKLLFMLDGVTDKGYLILDPYVSEARAETDIGSYFYYAGEDTYYMYVNGEECITGGLDEQPESALDITFFNTDWTKQTYHYSGN